MVFLNNFFLYTKKRADGHLLLYVKKKKGFTKKLGLGVYGDFFFDFGEVAGAEAAFKKFF